MAWRLIGVPAAAACALAVSVSASWTVAHGGTRATYWGAWIGSQLTGAEAPWDWEAVRRFESRVAAGKPLSLLQWSSPFSSLRCGGRCKFAAATFERVRAAGAIPFFSCANSGIAHRRVAADRYNSYIAGWARAARAWGHPFFPAFRLGDERREVVVGGRARQHPG